MPDPEQEAVLVHPRTAVLAYDALNVVLNSELKFSDGERRAMQDLQAALLTIVEDGHD